MAKKPIYQHVCFRVINPYDPPLYSPKVPGWLDRIEEGWPTDNNRLNYQFYCQGSRDTDRLNVQIRHDMAPALAAATLRKIADMLDTHHVEVYKHPNCIVDNLTVDDGGALIPEFYFEDEDGNQIEAPELSLVSDE